MPMEFLSLQNVSGALRQNYDKLQLWLTFKLIIKGTLL